MRNIIIIFCLICLSTGVTSQPVPDDQYWHDIITPDSGMNGAVYAMSIFAGERIVGGAFTTAGGKIVNHVARWNDSLGWLPLGSGINGTVKALVWHDGYLFAGGQFTTVN